LSIADFAVTRRVTVAMMACAIVLLGLFALPRLPVALLPTFQPPVVSVTVNYGNTAPYTMESTVTRPIENAVSRVSGIDYLQSNSFTGQTVVRATFKYGTNINVAATDIQQQIARAATQLPNDPNLSQPQIVKADPNALPVVRLSVTDPTRPQRDLYDLFNNQLADEFAGVSGVGSVSVFGGAQRAIMVETDANVLAGYGLDTNAVVNKIKNENVDAPAGLLAIGPKEFTIRANSLYQNAAQVASTVLAVKNGAPVYIRDVARVTDGIQEIRSFARLDGVPSIGMSITAQPDANVIAVSDGVYAKIADFQKRYPTMHFGVVFDQQGFIRSAVDALVHTAIYGAILAVLIILLFLHSLRSTLIVAISLPISVMGTFFAAYMLNQSLNIMTLGGLALAVGLIVDDAVVVIENIYRHLAEGEAPREAARNATAQIFMAVLASTVTVVTVFIPLLLIPGLQGLIFGPFALVIIVGVAISLLVATTTVPMLSSIMLDRSSAHAGAHEGAEAAPLGPYQRFSAGFDRLYGHFEGGYKKLLGAAIDRPAIVLGTGLVLLALAIIAVKVGVVKTETFPASSSRFVRINVRTPNGTSVAVTNQVSQKVEDALRADPNVADVSVSVGSAFGGGGTRLVTNQASMAVALKPNIRGRAADDFVVQWQQRLGGLVRRSGASQTAPSSQVAAERAKYRPLRRALIGTTVSASSIDIVQQTVSQGSDAVAIQLYGPDINKLYSLGQGALPLLSEIPGIVRPDTNVTPSQPEVDINVDRRVAAQLGLSSGDIANIISTATSGTIASYWQTNGTQYPILVQLPAAQRRSLDSLKTMLIQPNAAAQGAITAGGGAGRCLGHRRRRERGVVAVAQRGTPFGRRADHAGPRPVADPAPEQSALRGDRRAGDRRDAGRGARAGHPGDGQLSAAGGLPLAIRSRRHPEHQPVPGADSGRHPRDRADLYAFGVAVRVVPRSAGHHDGGSVRGDRHHRVAVDHPSRVRADRVHRVADAGRDRGQERDFGRGVHQAAAARRRLRRARSAHACGADASAADPHDDAGDAGRHAAHRDRARVGLGDASAAGHRRHRRTHHLDRAFARRGADDLPVGCPAHRTALLAQAAVVAAPRRRRSYRRREARDRSRRLIRYARVRGLTRGRTILEDILVR
jgi:HAE1 family hydrophobic/amphiphilic exporter-1